MESRGPGSNKRNTGVAVSPENHTDTEERRSRDTTTVPRIDFRTPNLKRAYLILVLPLPSPLNRMTYHLIVNNSYCFVLYCFMESCRICHTKSFNKRGNSPNLGRSSLLPVCARLTWHGRAVVVLRPNPVGNVAYHWLVLSTAIFFPYCSYESIHAL